MVDNDQKISEFSEVFEFDSAVNESASIACNFDINQLGSPQPLFIRPGTEQFFHPSDRRGIFQLTVNQEIELFCTTGFTVPGGLVYNSIVIACFSDTVFTYNGIFYNINEFACRAWPTSVAQRRATTAQCFNQSTIVDVGFQVNNRFLKVFSACHNEYLEQNYYTEYELTPSSDGSQSSVTRPGWRQGDFYPGKNVDNLHTRVNQRNTIAEIINSPELADVYVEAPNSIVFLARGHMAAMTDFISANEQRSTFFFINTAPQWQTFNSMNWYVVELNTRRLAADRNIFLEVYTGTFGITQLRDEFGVRHEIFLDFPNLQIPVPMLYYKIIVNRANRAGAVFIGVNNPHLTISDIERDYIICTDVSDQIDYMTWQREDLRRGFSYACEVNEFLRRVPHIPGLVVTSLLV